MMNIQAHAFRPRCIVMTGATSGFGAQALRCLAADQSATIIVGARGENRRVPQGVQVLPLDLASLASVQDFAATLRRRLGDRSIDVLILNAGIFGSDANHYSADGYGLTFAVNHLAHYLLARLLLPCLADHGRLVITTSNMHNPPFRRMAPITLDLDEWAHPTPKGAGTGMRAYCASKLCNLMTALSFTRLKVVNDRRIDVIAFNPGLTGGGGGRDASMARRAVFRLFTRAVYPLVGLFRPEFTMNTPEHSGRMLADVALGMIAPPEGRHYISLVKGQPTAPDPSPLARDIAAQDRLWQESACMVGLKPRYQEAGTLRHDAGYE